MSSLQRLAQSKGLPPLPSLPVNLKQTGTKGKKDYSCKPWTDYFEDSKEITIGTSKFQIYLNGTTGPHIVFLHGGGFSGLSWALLTKALTSLIDCRCVAIDLRGHGSTSTEDDYDLSADTLAGDVCDIIETLNDDSPIILIGHSMGGAIAVHAGATNRLHTLAGLVVIDVVEGTAMASLQTMHHVLQNRPQRFETIEKANEWCVSSGYIRNLKSVRVSMIGQLKRQEPTDGQLSDSGTPAQAAAPSQLNTISEEENSQPVQSTSQSVPKYVWRIDLSKTEKYWEGWFRGMSSLFLSVPVPKILLLAGVDRLDRDLQIGQMQGKFQMQVLPKSGHAVHEDNPEKVAKIIADFLIRHRLTTGKS